MKRVVNMEAENGNKSAEIQIRQANLIQLWVVIMELRKCPAIIKD